MTKKDAADITREHGPDAVREIFDESVRKQRERTNGSGNGNGHYEGVDDPDSSAAWDDPDISILDDRRGDLPEFPIEVFSKNCREWVERAAHGKGVTVAHVAIPLLGIASGVIGTARRVQASRSWTQPFTVWAAVIGESGTGKTPGLDCVRDALTSVERDLKVKIAEARQSHEAKTEAAKAARALWKKKLEEAVGAVKADDVVDLTKYREAKSMPPPLPPEAVIPPPFVVPRLHVTDGTIERLAVLLTARQRGMLVIRDELAGLFLNMARYNKGGSDKEFWLETWNGGPYTVERMSRDPIAVCYLLIGVVGGLQPDKLARSFSGDHDGLYGRMLFAWPSEPDYRELSDEVTEIEPEILNALRKLVDLEAGADIEDEFAPRAIPLAIEARAAFEKFRKLIHDYKRSFDGREREWLRKAQAHALRLAGTLEFLRWSFGDCADEPKEISVETMTAAVGLTYEYFWPHSRAALRQIGLSERHAEARRILRWLAAGPHGQFSLEEIRVVALGRTQDADQTLELIDGLTKSGWCKEIIPPERKGSGRPARRWAVNPKLFVPVGNTGNTGNTNEHAHLQ